MANLLAFDTSTATCNVGLLHGEKITVIDKIAPMQQAQLILPFIHDLLAKNGLTINDLDAIAYGCGPGSFTGIRIASSVAQGLALAANKPVLPISSLSILAQTAAQNLTWNKLLVAVDARMNEIYWGKYTVDDHGFVVGDGKEIVCPASGISLPESKDWYGIGDAWGVYSKELILKLGFDPLGLDPELVPSTQALLALAKHRWQQGDKGVSPAEAVPHYLR